MNDLERGVSPVATDRVATFKISFFSGFKSFDFQGRVISTYVVFRTIDMEREWNS